MPLNNPLKIVQNKCFWEFKGRQAKLGEILIIIDAQKNDIKSYSRIIHLKQVSPILKSATQSRLSQPAWILAVASCLDKIGIGTNVVQNVHQKAYKRLSDISYQEASLDINRDNSRLRTFDKIKRAIRIEKYLLYPLDLETRTAIRRFRISNHDLMIEKGDI